LLGIVFSFPVKFLFNAVFNHRTTDKEIIPIHFAVFLSKIKVSKIIYKPDYQDFDQWGGISDERSFFFDEQPKFLHEGGGKHLY
jgi:hypothetical protein